MSTVYFVPSDISSSASAALQVLDTLVKQEHLSLPSHLLIKIHPGAIGNTAFIPADKYNPLINYLRSFVVSPAFVETCMESSDSASKEAEFAAHGFDQIPHLIADGPKGEDFTEVPISGGRHFHTCSIAQGLAESPGVLVASHFKGHCMAGFGGALKMLGIGFASSSGKTEVHNSPKSPHPRSPIDWSSAHLPGMGEKWVQNWNPAVVSSGVEFRQRIAEYALAAVQGKKHLYLTFALNIVNNCDCDGSALTPVYPDLGVFASLDPVALDQAVFDSLKAKVGETPFQGEDILSYAQSLGLGSTKYHLSGGLAK